MFIRLRESLKRDKRLISKGRAEAYQEMQAAWKQRRREAEAKGLNLTNHALNLQKIKILSSIAI